MNRITSRNYKSEKDFQTMIDLLAALRPPEHRDAYPVRVDIEENLASFGSSDSCRI